jgi:hypothetical protein
VFGRRLLPLLLLPALLLGACDILDEKRDYGNKYSNGMLPVGDGKYSTTAASKGSIFLCNANAGGGGASTKGPWFNADGKTWDSNTKAAVQGSVQWDGNLSITVSNGRRRIVTNDLPDDHTTGVFPVASSDPAYQYDRNPNTIKAQSLTYDLPASPTKGDKPICMSGQVGVMLTGVALFNGFDALLRDAGAWEVQDSCEGHPEKSGSYHYHTLSSCIADVDVHTVIGWALDGFPITGPKLGPTNILTTDDLDQCHGLFGDVTIDGKKVHTYHYVMTQDFPYSAGCFWSAPIKAPGEP